MRAAITILICSFSTAAYSQEAIRLCALVKDDKDRLACFDGLTKAPPAQPDKITPGEWSVTEDRAPLDDSPQIRAILPARDNKSGLVLRCWERSTEAAFFPGGFLGSSNPIKVVYRIGQAAPISAQWMASQQGTATFSPAAGAFIRALPDNQTMFFRATGWRSESHDATFDLGAVSDVRAKIAAACKWGATTPAAKAKSPK